MSMDLLKNLLFSGFLEDYRVYIEDFDSLDKITFFKKYIEINEKIDEEEKYVWGVEFKVDGIQFQIDQWLEKYGVEYFNWKSIFKEIDQNDLDENEYILLLFENINKELEKIKMNYKVKFINMREDGYFYILLISNEKYKNINTNDFIFNDVKTYDLYLLTKTMNTKIMSYLKNKFDINLSEIKDFIKQEKILLDTGTIETIKFNEKKIKEIGGEVEIIEKLNW